MTEFGDDANTVMRGLSKPEASFLKKRSLLALFPQKTSFFNILLLASRYLYNHIKTKYNKGVYAVLPVSFGSRTM